MVFVGKNFSQNQVIIDSLNHALENFRNSKLELNLKSNSLRDSTEAILLYQLAKAYMYNTPDVGIEYAEQCLKLAELIGFKRGEGLAHLMLGLIKTGQGSNHEALNHNKAALKLFTEVSFENGIVNVNNNIGMIYYYQSNYQEALKYFLLAMKGREKLGDKHGLSQSLVNIGNIYKQLGKLEQALKYYKDALILGMEIGDKSNISGMICNIGNVYMDQGKYPEALVEMKKALEFSEESDDKFAISMAYLNLSAVYSSMGKREESDAMLKVSLKISEELGDMQSLAVGYSNLAASNIRQKKFGEAKANLEKGLSVAQQTGSHEHFMMIYDNYAYLDSSEGNFERALKHYRLSVQYRDSIKSDENIEQITRQQMQYEYDKKELLTRADQEKKDAISQKELQKQKLVRNSFIGGFAIVLLFAGVFYRQRTKISVEKSRAEEERKKSEAEKARSDELLLNILPGEVAEELKTTGIAKAKSYTMATVMFTDFKDFTLVSEKVSAELLVDEIHYCFSAFDTILQNYKIEKIKTIGDSYMCAGGIPVSNYSHAIDMINAAIQIRSFMLERKKEKLAKGEIPFEIRIGIHTGPLVAGVVGIKKYAYDIWGDTVNIAARIEQSSEAGKINISSSTYELVKEKFFCTHRGKLSTKNKGDIEMYFVEPK